MKFLPLFVRSDLIPALVIGAGKVGARKVRSLREADVAVRVVAPYIDPSLLELEGVVCEQRTFDNNDLQGAKLVIAATDDRKLNASIARQCEALGILVNTATHSLDAGFILPSTINRDPIRVAITTTGASPALARLLRNRLESLLPPSYSRLATLLEKFRRRANQSISNSRERGRFWAEIVEGPIADLVHAGRDSEAQEALEKAIANVDSSAPREGEVWIVGAGPGDPDLLTVRALRLMQQADVVVVDRLVSPAVQKLVRAGAEVIYAGKRRSEHSIPQDELNLLLVKRANQGQRVCRLKGGDPFIFGRGAEEIETLVKHNVRFQVVPGITAASGCASYAGIPLTHRDYAQSCAFITGNRREDGGLELDWDFHANSEQTLVFYMSLASLPTISEQLIQHGLPATTPAALVQQGTTPHQRVLISNLSEIAEDANVAAILPPSLLIIGKVVSLYHKLRWYRTGADTVTHASNFFDQKE
ncbi:MAG: siroheme synthase CysG [Granulosicoccaceae bacterium]